jgi:Protein of unknown function (DUF4246)
VDFGAVTTPQGRLLGFPNTFQHRVEPFELDDPTQPGHRKIAVLWLVNPQTPIISTDYVPPQQGVIPDVEAKKFREELMTERRVPAEKFAQINARHDFCEH